MSHSAARLPRPQVLRRSRVTSDVTFCSYAHRACMQPRLEGYEFCSRHILEDKNSPYKQCQYTSSKTAKRCTSAALKGDRKDGYCVDHARRAAHIRLFISRKRCPKKTPETLLNELEHYTPRGHNSSVATDTKKGRGAESRASKILEYATSSDSDTDGLNVEQTWRGDGDSDAESIDSEQEDPLKHAGVYTAEEVALITRDKLIRLQSLYIDQFKRLQHVMKEKRRRYLHNVRKEREALGEYREGLVEYQEALGSIHYAKHDPDQRRKYEGLVAMKRYHRRFGQEALMHRQSKERRIAVSEGPNYRPPSYPKCIQSKNGGKCGARTVPLSKYCFEHILSDAHQVLYKSCDFGGACKRPVGDILDNSACLYHAEPEDIEYRLPSKKEEKDESKDEIDVVGGDDSKHEEPYQSLQLQLQLKQEQLELNMVRADKGTNPKPHISPELAKEGASASTDTTKPTQPNKTSVVKADSSAQQQQKELEVKSSSTLRAIIPHPVQLAQTPTKPTQVPSVVNDLLQEEATMSLTSPKKLLQKPRTEAQPGEKLASGLWPQIPTTVDDEQSSSSDNAGATSGAAAGVSVSAPAPAVQKSPGQEQLNGEKVAEGESAPDLGKDQSQLEDGGDEGESLTDKGDEKHSESSVQEPEPMDTS